VNRGPEQNSDALAAAIRRLANEPGLGSAMGRMGQERVRNAYTWGAVARQMHSIYGRICNGG